MRISSTLAALDKQIEAAETERAELEKRVSIQEAVITRLGEARVQAAACIRKRKAKTPPPAGATP